MTGFLDDGCLDGRSLRLNRVTVAPSSPAELVLTGPCGSVIGRLRFRVCRTCRAGRIMSLWICDTWQRQGLGRELVYFLLAQHRGYRWNTTPQSRLGRAFFAAVAQESAVSLRRGSPLCPHLMGWCRWTWRRLLHSR